MGFALSGAASGAATSLQDLLKQKFLENLQMQRLQEDARQADQGHAMDLKQLEATEGLRRDTLASTNQYRDEMNKDRDATRQDMAAYRQEAQDLAAETRFQGRLKMLPKGARVTGAQAVDFARYGASPMLKPAVNSLGEPEFAFAGTQDANEAEARAAETAKQRGLQNDIADQRVKLAEAAGAAARDRANQPNAPQVYEDKDGNLRALSFDPVKRQLVEVALPEGITRKATAARPPQTPEDIQAASKAHTAGALAAKEEAGGTGTGAWLKSLLTTKPAATAAPKVGDTKKFPNGKTGKWDGEGWVLQ